MMAAWTTEITTEADEFFEAGMRLLTRDGVKVYLTYNGKTVTGGKRATVTPAGHTWTLDGPVKFGYVSSKFNGARVVAHDLVIGAGPLGSGRDEGPGEVTLDSFDGRLIGF